VLSGTFIEYVETSIADLTERIEVLEETYNAQTNQYEELFKKITALETDNKDLKQQYSSLLERIKKLEDKS
jgi:uncharacterized coiled-coil protein SlyX